MKDCLRVAGIEYELSSFLFPDLCPDAGQLGFGFLEFRCPGVGLAEVAGDLGVFGAVGGGGLSDSVCGLAQGFQVVLDAADGADAFVGDDVGGQDGAVVAVVGGVVGQVGG